MVLSILNPSLLRYDYYFDAQNTRISKKLDMGEKTLQFEMPAEHLAQHYINLEWYIDADGDRYVIKEITTVTPGTASVFCKLAVDDLQGKVYPFFESIEQTLYNTVWDVLHNTGWEFTSYDYSSSSKKRTIRMNDCSVLDLIRQVNSTFNCECYFDTINKIVHFTDSVGEVRDDTFFINDFNLKKLEIISDTHELYTEIEPYGKDGMQPSSYVYVDGDRAYLKNNSYSQKAKRYIWRDDRYTVESSLREDAQAKLAAMAVPKVSYKIDIIDLYRNDELFHSRADSLDMSQFEFDIGDTITVVGTETNTLVRQRVVEMTLYPDEPDRNTFVISNITRNAEDYLCQTEDDAAAISRISGIVEKIDDSTLDFSVENVSVTMSDYTVSGGDGLFIRRWGKVVTITGSVIMSNIGNNQVIASFFSGAAPTRATFVSCNAGGASVQSSCLITTSGTVVVNAFSTDALRIHGVWIIS